MPRINNIEDLTGAFTEKYVDRFWSKADVRSEDECWLWQRGVSDAGYGQFSAPKVGGGFRTALAHRVSYSLEKGHLERGMVIDHLCRVRSCVNPKHLELVTYGDNVRRGDTPGNDWSQGEKHAVALLTDAQATEIRVRVQAGEKGKDLALEFGVSRSTVSMIKRNKTWRHLING